MADPFMRVADRVQSKPPDRPTGGGIRCLDGGEIASRVPRLTDTGNRGNPFEERRFFEFAGILSEPAHEGRV
jgi:hypothetical protein